MAILNNDGSRANGIPAEQKAVVLNAEISEGVTTLANDVDGSITGLDHNGDSVTVTTFTLKMTGGFLFKKITGVTGIVITDLVIVI